MTSLVRVPGWAGRTQVERVEFYTRSSLYVLLWLLLLLTGTGAAGMVEDRPLSAAVVVGTLALGVASTMALRVAIRLYPDAGPLPRAELIVLVVLATTAEALVFVLPQDARFSASLLVLGSLAWGAGGLRDRRVRWCLYVASPLVLFAPTGIIPLAAYGLGAGLFLIFSVQSSLWLLGVVKELDEARGNHAALAVAEERLRFSRDVHDVLGRRLATIAVQSELAATLSRRGDHRAADRILEVRETAHEALREARQLARGYRPLDLAHEVEGAVSLLRSAGVDATADLTGLPELWHEPVARVIRESVTNVLRHSRARHVTMTYAEGEVVIRNDGVHADVEASDGTGLRILEEQLRPLGARLVARHVGDEFLVRLLLMGEPAVAESVR
jgi:two-component system sensor histidine kinase DesK